LNALALLDRLRAAGVAVEADGGNIRLRSAEPLAHALVAAARDAKADLLQLLHNIAEMNAACEARAGVLVNVYADPEVLADADAIRPSIRRDVAA
jgi:hypothetical protein